MKTAIFLSLSFLLPRAVAAQTSAVQVRPENKKPGVRLKPGKPIEKELAGGATDAYEIRVKKAQFLHVVAEQKGIDVVLTLVDPLGRVLVEADSPNGAWGPEPASIIAASSGIYQAHVTSLDKSASAGKYTIAVEALHNPKPEDQTRIQAEKKLFAAARLGAVSSGDSLQKAADLYEGASALWHSVKDPYEEGQCLKALGDLREAGGGAGDLKQALDYYTRALGPVRAAQDQRDEARILGEIARIQNEFGENEASLRSYNEAVSLYRVLGDRHNEAVALSNMGNVLTGLGQLQKALDYLTQSLSLRRQIGDRTGEAAVLNNIGGIYDESGDKRKALDYYLQASELQPADRKLQGYIVNNIAGAYDDLGELQKALEYYKQALPLRREVGDRRGEAATLHNIGGVYHTLAEYREAIRYYEQALILRRTVGDPRGEASTLNGIGGAYADLGENRKALEYFNQALPLRRAVGDRRGEAVTLNRLGDLYASLGERDKALECLNSAISLEEAVGDRYTEMGTLSDIAECYEELHEKQKAIETFHQALALSRTIQNPLTEGRILDRLMLHWMHENNAPLAIFFGKQSVNLFQEIRRNIRGLDKELQKSFLESKAGTYRDLGDLLIAQGRLAEAQQVLDLLKEEEYFEFVRGGERSAEVQSKPISLSPEEEASHEAYEKIAGQITAVGSEWSDLRAKRNRTDSENARIAELDQQLKVANQEVERFFKKLYAEFGKNAQANQRAGDVREQASGMQTLVRELGPGTVALYTLVGEARYSVIVITASTMQAREYPISATDLRKKVATFLEALKNPANNPLPASQELYKILVAPIAGDLKGAKAQTLMWSLNDVLRYVPMAALHDGKQYLVENYRNVVITPASIGRLKDKVDVSESSIAGMGVSKDYDGLGPLPAVPSELKSITHANAVSAGGRRDTMLLDDDFTETHMASALDKHYPVVHIASHFVLQAGNETNSYLLLGGKDVGGKGYHLTLAELRDDPALTFDGTDLLTLSACQTATSGTALNGREVDGLGITAQRRGAKAVLASLWSVADESTAEFMADFYKQWLGTAGMTKAAALQAAQRKMLRGENILSPGESRNAPAPGTAATASAKTAKAHYTHPYYWAPFILIGNWK